MQTEAPIQHISVVLTTIAVTFMIIFLQQQYVYDASYVKLRELSLGYTLPSKLISSTPFSKVTISFVGRNLWIIHKNMPYYDPEYAISAGNIQGVADGAYPSTRTYGFNLSIGF